MKASLWYDAAPPEIRGEPDDEATATGFHELKTWPEPFEAVWSGDKLFEWRKADRNFVEGDRVRLREWDPKTSDYTGRELTADVGFVLRGPSPFGVPEGFCIFSLLDVRVECWACEVESASQAGDYGHKHTCRVTPRDPSRSPKR